MQSGLAQLLAKPPVDTLHPKTHSAPMRVLTSLRYRAGVPALETATLLSLAGEEWTSFDSAARRPYKVSMAALTYWASDISDLQSLAQ